ncbi:hypothetical protein PLICRDRAFT_57546 [Plicaturopsis crispa FD-325 SS-3]|uniref:High affinity methionine permease n=1 Tax=Plicaturopsis crispa FD-325 SS-3 TaxID=944288 RepID=A0A0C9SKY9_PLICR|nr:hypothetical protein PLICRDRAFT_57546 [Plicaturopsis crispa FD-325 SS-3]
MPLDVAGQTDRESDPLLEPLLTPKDPAEGVALHRDDGDENGESFDDVPHAKRQLGIASASFLIFNRVIGTGIFATPSVILRSSGSVGVAMLMWLLGAVVAAAGTSVFIELGTGLPRSGGEKNYLEYIYRRPKFLATCIYATYSMLIGSSSANSIVFGEYVLHALDITPSQWNARFIAVACLTFVFILHGTFLTAGLRLQNGLGFFKLLVLLTIAVFGVFHLAGVPGFAVRDGYEVSHNLRWSEMWEGSGTGANAFVESLYNVIWSFIGYSNANYALSEIRDPVRTIKRAAPAAMVSVTVVYMFVNVAYFAVVSKSDILGSGRIIAALFFRNLFGPIAERILSTIIALSTLGNILAVLFSQGRVVQELGREGIIPYSSFFASNKPFNAPLPGLFWQWLFSALYVMAPPPGDAYLFMLNMSSYPHAIINTFVSGGLLFLYTPWCRKWEWNPPFRAPKLLVAFFFASNIFLIFVPLIPPLPGTELYDFLPYWSHVFVAVSISLFGVVYWYIWSVWLPRRNGYVLVRQLVRQDDGISRSVFRKVAA